MNSSSSSTDEHLEQQEDNQVGDKEKEDTSSRVDPPDEVVDCDDNDEDGEFYDVPESMEKLNLSGSKDDDADWREESSDTRTSNFVPLHEELNKRLEEKANIEEKNEDDADGDLVNEIVADEDPYFVDDNWLKEEEAKLSEDDKKKNLEEALKNKQLGNEAFKNEKYTEALEFYTEALKICPYSNTKERSIFYSNRAVCFFKLKNYERCIKECTCSIELDATYAKPLARRAECYETQDKLDEALEDYKKLVALETSDLNAHKRKCYELEEKIKERNEKLKTEMMGKLKDLGNMILKPFGLSTNNFEFVQDPNSGSYSVNFKK